MFLRKNRLGDIGTLDSGVKDNPTEIKYRMVCF